MRDAAFDVDLLETGDQMAQNRVVKISVASLSVAAAVYGLYSGSVGDAMFGITIGIGALIEVGIDDPDRHFFRGIERLRGLFQNAARAARFLIAAIVVGGTLLVIDLPYDISFVPQFVDPLIKRLAPALVVAALAFYCANIVSNAIYRTSEERRDKTLRRYEVFYYLSAIVLIISFTVLMLGTPVEVVVDMATAANGQAPRTDKVTYPSWPFMPWALIVVVLIGFVWGTGSFLCIVSREAEWLFGRVLNPALPSGTATPAAPRATRAGRGART